LALDEFEHSPNGRCSKPKPKNFTLSWYKATHNKQTTPTRKIKVLISLQIDGRDAPLFRGLCSDPKTTEELCALLVEDTI